MSGEIDLVLPWVDGNDPKWQEEKSNYENILDEGDKINRYRDWDMLQYIFRGIEKNLPWVRKVHFVTWGHIPSWLNTECEKLNIVKHEDFIPSKYLPTFSSHPIELNMFRIKELSEQFIYANDDMFFLQPMSREDFFVEGIPKDSGILTLYQWRNNDFFNHIRLNNLQVINVNFNKREVVRKNFKKWFSFKYKKELWKNFYLLPSESFVGFVDPHIPQPFLKSTFKNVWKKEYEILDRTSSNKFRSKEDVNQWVMRYWQLATGKFIPCSLNRGEYFGIGADDRKIKEAIINQKYQMICLNDIDDKIDFESEKRRICRWFDKVFSTKSAFEL